MATALREPDVSLPDPPDLPEPLSITVDGIGDVTSIQGTGDRTQTQRILVRELGILPISQGGPFGYVARGRNYNYSTNGLDTILGQLLNGTFQPNGTVADFPRPLDLNLSVQTCFVLFLRALGEPACDWRFSTDVNAVTLGDFTAAYKPEKDDYFDMRHVMSLTDQSPIPYPHPQQCRIVYFFAKRPVRTEFAHPINISVEMYFPEYNGVKNTIPIVIDPDVRYPGGSGVDGGSP